MGPDANAYLRLVTVDLAVGDPAVLILFTKLVPKASIRSSTFKIRMPVCCFQLNSINHSMLKHKPKECTNSITYFHYTKLTLAQKYIKHLTCT